eukprot:220762_1
MACGKCDKWKNLLWLIPMTICAALLVVFFLFDSKPIDCSIYYGKEVDYIKWKKKDEITAMVIMIFKVFMYYFQSLSQILFSQSITNAMLPLVSFFTLSLDYSSSSTSGICIIPFISSPLLKILFSPMFVVLLIFNLCWMGFALNVYYTISTPTNNENNQQKQQQSITKSETKTLIITVAVLKVFVMTAGTLLGVGFKLLTCIKMPGTGTGNMIHLYEATQMCFDNYWMFGLILCLIVVVFFIALFIRIYYQTKQSRTSPHNVYRNIVKPFKTEYWWYEFVLFSRRFVIAAFTSLRLLSSNDIHIFLLIILMIYLVIHCVIFPFKYQRLNIVETICLCTLLIISGVTIEMNENNEDFGNLFISFAIIFPFLFIVAYTIKSILFLVCGKKNNLDKSEIQKIKQRRPIPISINDNLNETKDKPKQISEEKVTNLVEMAEKMNETEHHETIEMENFYDLKMKRHDTLDQILCDLDEPISMEL